VYTQTIISNTNSSFVQFIILTPNVAQHRIKCWTFMTWVHLYSSCICTTHRTQVIGNSYQCSGGSALLHKIKQSKISIIVVTCVSDDSVHTLDTTRIVLIKHVLYVKQNLGLSHIMCILCARRNVRARYVYL
jgi:hypothetical protein